MNYLIDKSKFFDIWSDKLTIPVVAIDIVIFTIYKWELCLVLWNDKVRFKDKYAIPGWIVAKWYSLEENFDNILERETWIRWVYKEQLYAFWNPDRDTRGHVISISYYALVNVNNMITNVDFTKVELVKYSKFDDIKFMYDHKEIIRYAKQRLNWKLEYTNIAKDLLKSSFRISELQNIYETILCTKLDKRNFQKKVFKLGIIKETWEMDKSTNRPAKLYTFVDKELKIYEVI